MTPQQALQILDQVTALAPINRIDQGNTQMALQVLQQFVQSNTPETPTQETDPTPETESPKEDGEPVE